MKNLTLVFCKTKVTVLVLLFMQFVFCHGFAQQYGKMKITLSEGMTFEGSKGSLSTESVSLLIDGQSRTYSLDKVRLVMAKKGNAWMWALGSGGCCLGIGLAVTAANPNNDDPGTLLLGSALWAGIFAGTGYIIGILLDPWQNVYMSKSSAALNRLELYSDVDHFGRPLFGLSFSF